MLVYVDKECRLLLNSTVEEILPPRISRLRASSEAPQVWSQSSSSEEEWGEDDEEEE